MFDQIAQFLWGFMQTQIKNTLLDLCQNLLTLIAKGTSGFFTNNIISAFLSFSQWANIVVLTVSFLFMLFDLAEEHATNKDVDYTVLFGNIVKGIIFVEFNAQLAIMAMSISDIITTQLNFKITASANNIFAEISQSYTSVTFTTFLLLAILIGAVVFFVMSVMRYGAMFVHILSSSLYIGDILRGDTTSIGSWLRQMVAIAITYVMQYICFYLGLFFLAEQDIIMWAIMWAGMAAVTKILQKFGYSTGTKGFFGTTGSLASQGISQGLSLVSKI